LPRDPSLIEVTYPDLTYVENKTDKIKLDVGNYIRNLQLLLTMQVDSAAGWTANLEDNPMSVIKDIELYGLLKRRGKGRVTFYQIGADLLYYYNYFMAKTQDHRVQKPSAASQSDEVCEVRLELNFLPKFVIDTNQFTELWLKVLWGDGDDLAIAAASTTIDFGTIEVQSEEYTSAPRKLMGWMREISEKSQNIAAAGEQALELPKSMLYRQLMVEVIDDSIRNDDLVTKLNLKYGRAKSAFQSSWDSLKVKNKNQFGVETLEDGYVTIEGITMLPMRQLIDPTKYETWELEFVSIAPTATATIRTLIERVAPLS